MILDPFLEERIRSERRNSDLGRYDEVWDGVLVVAPLPNNDHQQIVMELCLAFRSVTNPAGGDRVFPGINLSDREKDWTANYREPDVAVYLGANPGKDCGTHWVGGPDLAVEIVSPGEEPRDKLEFYAKVNTREVLIVDRNPWVLELYQLQGNRMALVGRSEAGGSQILASGVLPLTFQLQLETVRPVILLTHTLRQEMWKA
jgi:Uma2 family endonuclease